MPRVVDYRPRQVSEAARKAVGELYKKYGYYHEVMSKLRVDKTLDEPVGKITLQIAKARSWEEAIKLGREIWEVVNWPGREIETYRVALGKAEMANRLEPNDRRILALLGVAQYRVGAYQDALMTMINVEKMRADAHLEPGPSSFAIMAAALHQLGRDTEAQAALNQLRALLEDPKWVEHPTGQAGAIEAEKLFAGENTKLYSVWQSIEEGRLKDAVQLIEELRSSKDAETAARIEGAVKWLRKAYYNAAQDMIVDGKFAEAISDYEEAVRVDPGYAPAFDGLAWLRATCLAAEFRDGDKAVEQATKACELTDFKNAHYVGTLAAAYAEAGDFDAAIKWQKETIDLLTEKQEYLRADFEERLKLYQSGKPYRESP